MDDVLDSVNDSKPKGVKGFPPAQLDNISAQKAKVITRNLIELQAMDKPRSDTEIVSRIDSFFNFCADSGCRPGIEALCLSLHITRTTLFRWSQGQGCSDFVRDAVIQAKNVVTAYIEQAQLSGSLNPASAIFLLKNWANYKDTVSLEDATPQDKNNNSEKLSEIIDQLGIVAKRKTEDSPDDDVGSMPYFGD